jgi:hypothetical protein
MPSISRFIVLIQKVEAAYPEWTTDQLITNLRHIGPLDGVLFQQLLGTKPGIDIQPKGNLTEPDVKELRETMNHGTPGNQETGISMDESTGRNVTLGHVVVGISAGIHHPPPVIYVEIGPVTFPVPDLSINKQRVGLDPLYATTITGDLGQTATPPSTLCSQKPCAFGGVGSEATSAELDGDIDGFMLGYWLSTTSYGQDVRSIIVQNNSIKLSTILLEYYRGRTDHPIGMIAGSGFYLEAIRRFFNFTETFKVLKNDFAVQAVAFNLFYAPKIGKQSPNPQQTLTALNDFDKWCSRGGI